MELVLLPFAYFRWHYGRALLGWWYLWRNFIWFWFRFFSIADLGRTFFSPWRRLGEGYGQTFNLEKWLESFLVNTLMRLVGIIVKTVILIIWLLAVLGTIISGLLALVVWVLLPVISILSILVGLHLILSVI